MKEKINTFIREHLLESDFELKMEDDLLNTGLVDSIGVVKLIEYIEREFDVSVPPDDMVIENFISINAIEKYLASKD